MPSKKPPFSTTLVPNALVHMPPDATVTKEQVSDETPITQDEPASLPPAGDWQLFRGTGHIEDEPDDRDYPVAGARRTDDPTLWKTRAVSQIMSPLVEPPPHVDLPTGKIRDQRGTSECVAFTFARHINARLAFLTFKEPDACVWPSEHGIYGGAREDEAKDEHGNFVIDGGCYPRDAATALMAHGVVREERLPFDEATVNNALPWDVLTAGYDARITRFHRCMSSTGQPDEFLNELERLLASGYTVPYAQDIDRGFNDYDGSGIIQVAKGETKGSHYTCLRGYDRAERKFFGDNSWGKSWGKSGRYEISYDRIISQSCRDFIILITIPGAQQIR